MDAAALSLCKENRIPIIVLNLQESRRRGPRDRGERVGTLVRILDIPRRDRTSHAQSANARQRMESAIEALRREFAERAHRQGVTRRCSTRSGSRRTAPTSP
jgi:hypothetical protein